MGTKKQEYKTKGKRRSKHLIRRGACFLGGLAAALAICVGTFALRSSIDVLADASYTWEELKAAGVNRTINQSSKGLRRIALFAHRGFDADVLENSFASFDTALMSGCPQIELDVWPSADGVLYVSHDNNVKRITGQDLMITNTDSEVLDTLEMTNGEKLHRLEEVFDRYRNQMLYLVEIKAQNTDADSFVSILEQRPKLAVNVQVQSFYSEVLQAIHEKLPNMYKQLLVSQAAVVEWACQFDFVDSIGLEKSLVTEKRIQMIHDYGREVWAWTVDSPSTIRKFLGWGIDGIITDLNSAVLIVKELQSTQ